jgi:hypothetical protein
MKWRHLRTLLHGEQHHCTRPALLNLERLEDRVVLNGSAAFVRLDATTQGNWIGAYGHDGYNVIDGAVNYPSYAQVTPSGQTDYVWRSNTGNPRALQVPGGWRVAATWYSRTSYTVDVNLTDGQTHGLALYLLDWDKGGLSERIDVKDAQSGAALGSWTVSSFANGRYLVLNVSGHLTVQITDVSGADCDLSGLFFDPQWGGPGSPLSATFTGPASVAEGATTATVSFSSVAGGSGGYKYSYDFNNDGVFEVTGSSSASATVPESYLDDGPSTRVARGRVTDSSGAFKDYTTSIAVTNVAPTPSIGLPPSVAPGTAATFTASATDPSTADTKAGFSYSWNFGDGSAAVAGASPSHSYAKAGTYTVNLTATDKDGGQGSASASVTAAAAGAGPSALSLQDFNGAALPVNGDGDGYPNEMPLYSGAGGTEGGTAALSLDPGDAVSGSSLEVSLTSGSNFYLQFNPYNYANSPAYPSQRSFARNYAQGGAQWQFNTYNYLSFWIQLPANEPDWTTGGDGNFNVGTYVKQVTNADPTSDETGGNHYYHNLILPTGVGGAWTHVILGMHPDHVRGGGIADPGVLTYPTTAAFGGDDPAGTYNYFDALSRFYIEDDSENVPLPAVFHVDDVQFLRDPYQENDAQAYQVTSTYQASTNRLVLTWMHKLGEDSVNQEVRYSFTDIHQTGWAAATPAPNGIVTPPGSGGYNGMIYDNSALPLAGHSVVYIAIKPQNSSVFTQVAVPLSQWVQTSAADFSAGAQSGAAVTNTSGGEVQLAPGPQAGTYQASGTLTSAVFDAGAVVTWLAAKWDASLPAGTSITVQTRGGNTAAPDASWSAWAAVTNGGSISSPRGRYFQYRVTLTTTNATLTPTLYDIWFSWS